MGKITPVTIRIIQFNDISIGSFYEEASSMSGFRIFYKTPNGGEYEVLRSEPKYSNGEVAINVGSKLVKAIRNTDIEKLKKLMTPKDLF